MQSARTRWTLTRDPAVRRTIKIAVDFSCGVLAVLIAFAVQSGRGHPNAFQILLTSTLAGAIVAAVNAIGISYRTTWRYVGVKEPLVFMGCSAAVFVTLGTLDITGAVPIESASMLVAAVLAQVFCSSARTARRWRLSLVRRRRREAAPAATGPFGDRHRVLIVGAGHVGFEVGQQLRDRRLGHVELIGFLDDDRSKIGTLIDDVPVLGQVEEMLSIAERYNATEVIIAMPSAPSEFVRALVRRAEDIGLRARAVGDVGRLLTSGDNHRPGTINLRELSTETVVDWPVAGGRPSARGARRVLVTGGAGFIGSHLTRMLLDRNYHVRVLDNFTYGYAGLAAIRNHPRLEIVTGDICNLRDVGRAMRDVEGVIGLAAIVGDPACNLDPEETINLNYAATKILAEAADFYRVQRLVFASSCSVYGASAKEDDLLNERSRLNPVSLYARTRVLSENIIFDRCGDTEPVVLRLATVFGLSPRMRFDLVVNTLTARAVVDHTIAIFGGRQWRPNVHCRDAARAFLMALEAPGEKVAGEVFNVGGDENNHRISEIGEIVASMVGDVAVSLQNEIPDPRDYRVSFEKIRRVLNFIPEYSVRDGVREVASAMRADLSLRTHMDPMFHNVQALRQALAREIPSAVRATA